MCLIYVFLLVSYIHVVWPKFNLQSFFFRICFQYYKFGNFITANIPTENFIFGNVSPSS